MDVGDSGRDGTQIRGKCQGQAEQGAVPTEFRSSLGVRDDLPRSLRPCQESMQPFLHSQDDLPTPLRYQGNIPDALQSITHTLFGVQEDLGSFQGLTLPLRLRKPFSRATGAHAIFIFAQPRRKLPSDKCKSPM